MTIFRTRRGDVTFADRSRVSAGVEMRSFALTDMIPYGWDARVDSSGTTKVGTDQTMGLPAFGRAVRYYSETIAGMQLCAWTGSGVDRRRVDSTYQGILFRQTPNPDQDYFQFWDVIGQSLVVARNAYIWKMKDPATGRVVEWWALDPVQVKPVKTPGGLIYRVRCDGMVDPLGKGKAYELPSDVILHIKGCASGGLVAPSIVEQYRDALAVDISAQLSAGSAMGKGTKLDYAFTMPPGISKVQAQEWKDNFRQRNVGPTGDSTMVLPPGMDVKTIGMTPKDAELIAMSRLSLEKAALIVGIPTVLLGPTGGPVDRTPLEEVLREWYSLGLGLTLQRIEKAIAADPDIFPRGTSTTYPGFKSDDFIRADSLTESQIQHQQIQDGSLLVDEARAAMGRTPLPGGVGSIPLVTPVGAGANPEPLNTPPPTEEPPA